MSVTARQWVLAIDFGTSYTVAVAAFDGQDARVLEIDGELRVPSVILADADRIVVGRVADEMSGARPQDVLRAPKARLGDQVPVILAGRTYQIAVLVGALLRGIYEEAVVQFGSPPREVRMTHPATWNRTRQARLLEAAALAGIPRTMLVPEPVAAALSYWHQGEVPPGRLVAVYDLGGGTFDSAVLQASDDGFRIVGRPDGDPALGGEMFDELVVNLIVSDLDATHWERIQLADDPSWRQFASVLRKEARRAKETLSSYPYADVLVSLPTGLAQVRVTRAAFDRAIAPYVNDSVEVFRRCIAEAGIQPVDLSAIQLVGGSSRIPAVEVALRAAFPGLDVRRRGDPKNAVALGALVASESAITPTPTGFGSSEEQRAAPVAQSAPLQPPPEQTPLFGPPSPPTVREFSPVTPVTPAAGAPQSAPVGIVADSRRRYAIIGAIAVVVLALAAVVVATRDEQARTAGSPETTTTSEGEAASVTATSTDSTIAAQPVASTLETLEPLGAGAAATDPDPVDTVQASGKCQTGTPAADLRSTVEVDGAGRSVGLLFDSGGRGDKSFNDGAAAALDEAAGDFGITGIEITPETGAETRADLLGEVLVASPALIVGVGFLWGSEIEQAAKEHPEQDFALIDDVASDDNGTPDDLSDDRSLPNVRSIVFAENEASFLVGVAAACASRSGRVGFTGGVQLPLIESYQAGFEAGVAYVDPNTTVDAQYLSQAPEFSGFNDPVKAKNIAAGMYGAGVDVIFHAAAASGVGLFQAVVEAGAPGDVWAIGLDSDQYLTADPSEQPYILTSALKRVDVATYDAIAAALDGSLVGETLYYDLVRSGVGYSTSNSAVKAYAGTIEVARAAIIDGSIAVPTSP